MPISQNATFSGVAEPDKEFAHPPGASIARLLRSGIRTTGWEVSGIENWLDGGWEIDCVKGEARLQVVLAALTDQKGWMLQISPLRYPGIIGRLLGVCPSATPDQVQSLATEVSSILLQSSSFKDFRWCWDGFPDDRPATSEPMPPPR